MPRFFGAFSLPHRVSRALAAYLYAPASESKEINEIQKQ